MSEPIMAMRRKSSNLTRCNLDTCGRTSQHFYGANIGGKQYTFCSGAHIAQAQKNFDINKSVVIPTPQESYTDYEQGEDFNDAV